MAGTSEEKLRTEIRKLIAKVDLATTSVGKLRASLEEALGLKPGDLDSRKDQVNRLLTEELTKKVEAAKAAPAEAEKKRKAGSKQDAGAPQKKEKKQEAAKDKGDKADKKKEKDKKQAGKKDEASSDEAIEAEQLPEPVPEPELAPAPEEVAVAAAPLEEDPFGSGLTFDPFAPLDDSELQEVPGSRQKAWAVSGGEDGQLRLWDLEGYTCQRVLEGHTGAIRSLAVDWEEMQALTGADDNVRLWSLKHGGCQKTFSDVEDGCGAVAADWKQLQAYAGCGNGQLKVWNMTTGELLKSVSAHPGGVWALEADWRRGRLASGGDEHFKVWDLSDWTCLQTIEGHPGGIMCISVDWQSARALVGVGSSELSLRIWDLNAKTSKNFIGHRDAVANVRADWSADREMAVSGGWDAQLRVWNLSRGTCSQSHECKFGRVRSLAVDFSQMQAICGSSAGSLHIVDLHSGSELKSLDGHVGGVLVLEITKL